LGAIIVPALIVAGLLSGPANASTARPTADTSITSDAVAGTNPRLSMIADPSRFTTHVSGMTPDGGHVYVKTTRILTPGDPSGEKVYDVHAGQNRVVTFGGNFPLAVLWSDDGSAVVFRTDKAIAAEDTDTQDDLYVDIGGSVHLVGKGTAEAVADDGSAVIFSTGQALVPEAAEVTPRADLFRWDLATEELTLLTPDTAEEARFAAATDDLQRVLIGSDETLAGPDLNGYSRIYERIADSYVLRADRNIFDVGPDMSWIHFYGNLSYVPEDIDGADDAYVWDSVADTYELLTPGAGDSHVAAIATDRSNWILFTADGLDPADVDEADDFYLVSATADPLLLTGNGPLGQTSISGNDDLSTLVITTTLGLVPADVDDTADRYRVEPDDLAHPDLLTGPMTPVSGYAPVYAISPDGNRIIFGWGEPLVPEDTNANIDLYAWEAGQTTLLTPNTTRTLLDTVIPKSAARVAFQTYDKVLAQDNDGEQDWYLVDFDVVAPDPAISGPASTTGSIALVVSTDGAERTECLVDGVGVGPCMNPWNVSGLVEGAHNATINAWDATGNLGTASKSWTVDTTAPTAKAPVASLIVGKQLGVSTVPMLLSWGGTDANGIASTKLEQQVDGGAWAQVAASVAGFTTTRSLAPGHAYRFRVTTRDGAGNLSTAATGSTFTLSSAQESSPRITFTGSWSTSTASSFMGGHARSSSSRVARASYRFTGKSVWWVTTTGPTRGTAHIWIDGTYRSTVYLYSSATTTRRAMYRFAWPTAGTHTIEIRVLGTAGHPRVDVDAFIVLR
jgi:hypothetical protein